MRMDILLPVIIVGVIALIAGIGLSLAAKFMAVPVDEKQEKIREALPGANCGACGFSGCDGYAAAVAAGEAEPNLCAPGGEAFAKAVGEILGVEVKSEKMIAVIACGGTGENTLSKYAYEGMQSCIAASTLYGGPLQCEFGCLGLGDCVRACTFDAIRIENGRPTVCADLCTGCGKCATACPKGVIQIIPKDAKVRINCSNKQKGAAVAKACKVSCLACTLCQKNCESGAIKIVDNLPVIDYSLCTGCGKCKEVCKRKIIV